MVIWKPLVGKCLQYAEEPRNKVNKHAITGVRADSHSKEMVLGHLQQKPP